MSACHALRVSFAIAASGFLNSPVCTDVSSACTAARVAAIVASMSASSCGLPMRSPMPTEKPFFVRKSHARCCVLSSSWTAARGPLSLYTACTTPFVDRWYESLFSWPAVSSPNSMRSAPWLRCSVRGSSVDSSARPVHSSGPASPVHVLRCASRLHAALRGTRTPSAVIRCSPSATSCTTPMIGQCSRGVTICDATPLNMRSSVAVVTLWGQ